MAEQVAELDVQLRGVERRLANCFRVGQARLVHRFAQKVLSVFPDLVARRILLGVLRIAEREAVGVLRDAQLLVRLFHQTHHAGEFGRHLLRRTKDVGVVQRHCPHATQPADDAGALVAVHRAELCQAHRQVAVAVEAVAVDEDVVRAERGAKHHLFVLQLHGWEHIVLEVLPVAGAFVELAFGDVRRVDVGVAGLAFQVCDELLQQAAHCRALRQPERQAGADRLVGSEELQLAAKAAMVAPLRVFDALQVRVQLLLRFEERAVDALEHRVVLVAAPVGAGGVRKLERADLAGMLYVRPFAEVRELAVLVEADGIAVDAVD